MVEYTGTRVGPGIVRLENVVEGGPPYTCEVSAPGYETEIFTVEVIANMTQSYATTLTPTPPTQLATKLLPLILLGGGFAILVIKEGVE